VFGNIDIKQVPLRLTVKLTFSNWIQGFWQNDL
jgi:hypothetical protein